jgi:hypothetical protein
MIRITRTSVVEYYIKEQDLGYYSDQDVYNEDKAALLDVKELEKGSFTMEDIDSSNFEETWKVEIVDAATTREPNPDNDERNSEVFPIEEEEKTGEDAEPYVPNAGNLQ